MSIEQVMEILDEFEVQAIREINLDHAVKADPYASIGKHILIGKIKKRINRIISNKNQEV